MAEGLIAANKLAAVKTTFKRLAERKKQDLNFLLYGLKKAYRQLLFSYLLSSNNNYLSVTYI